MAPYRTYAMAFTLPRGALADALYWDMADPYHYVRLQPGPGATDYLIVGGKDHKSGEADDGDIGSRRSKPGSASSCRNSAMKPRAGPGR